MDGVVFRKNVSHKKMIAYAAKSNPKIIILSSGLEFQRSDARLSSMDMLIEQETRYMELLVERVMSLKPGDSPRCSIAEGIGSALMRSLFVLYLCQM